MRFALDLLEYVALRVGECASQRMGPDRAYGLGRRLGRLGHALLASRRRTAHDNLARASLGSRDDLACIERRAFENLCGNVMESLAVLRRPAPYLDHGVTFDGLEHVHRALARGRGAIVAIAHLGNWELAGLAAARRGFPITSIVRPMHNAALDRFFVAARERTGQKTLTNRGSLCRMIRALRENRLLIVPCDQWPKSGVRVTFLGRPTISTRTPATLALRTGAPVLPVDLYRAGSEHRVTVHPPIEPESRRASADPVAAITQEVCRTLEGFIRAHPDQWLWMHDRWKPLGAMAPAADARPPLAPAPLAARG